MENLETLFKDYSEEQSENDYSEITNYFKSKYVDNTDIHLNELFVCAAKKYTKIPYTFNFMDIFSAFVEFVGYDNTKELSIIYNKLSLRIKQRLVRELKESLDINKNLAIRKRGNGFTQ